MKILNIIHIFFFCTKIIFRLMSQKIGTTYCLRDSKRVRDTRYEPKPSGLLRVGETRKKIYITLFP